MQLLPETTVTDTKTFAINPGKWIDDHYLYMLNYTVKRVSDNGTAGDLIQESFLAALEHSPGFEYRCSERTWLMSILKNKIADFYRKRGQQARLNASLNYDLPRFEMPKPTDDFLPLLDKAVKKLPGLWQAVFVMKHLEDHPAKEICMKLRISLANYWVINHRIKLNPESQPLPLPGITLNLKRYTSVIICSRINGYNCIKTIY